MLGRCIPFVGPGDLTRPPAATAAHIIVSASEPPIEAKASLIGNARSRGILRSAQNDGDVENGRANQAGPAVRRLPSTKSLGTRYGSPQLVNDNKRAARSSPDRSSEKDGCQEGNA